MQFYKCPRIASFMDSHMVSLCIAGFNKVVPSLKNQAVHLFQDIVVTPDWRVDNGVESHVHALVGTSILQET